MIVHPTRIIDMHTHLFNARYLPLAGIFANAICRDAGESALARSLADFVNRLTESDYLLHPAHTPQGPDKRAEFYIDELCRVAESEWRFPSKGNDGPDDRRARLEDIVRRMNGALPELGEEPLAEPDDDKSRFGEWIRHVVLRTLRAFLKAALPHGEIENYVEFIFNMLSSETRILATLVHGYGEGLPPLEFVHHMMDMQMAYVAKGTSERQVAPRYPYMKQLECMQKLSQAHPQVHGFAAFDPRRPDWCERAQTALDMGFIGFKFYPAMHYLPYQDKDEVVRERIYAFFDFCIRKDVPVFTHCTPQGFETRHRKGFYADPRGWEQLLASEDGRFAGLRLCFGHGGGDRATGGNQQDGYVHSPGWTADKGEWLLPDNYAGTVVRLCRRYPNVYCDLAYLVQLLEDPSTSWALERFTHNLDRELAAGGEPWLFADKVCFGTDWHMPHMAAQPRRYLQIFLKLFSAPERARYRDGFFWKNAARFMYPQASPDGGAACAPSPEQAPLQTA